MEGMAIELRRFTRKNIILEAELIVDNKSYVVFIVNLSLKGLLAGYVLPVTLVYILLIKLGIEKKKYFSTRNFFLPPVIIVSRFF